MIRRFPFMPLAVAVTLFALIGVRQVAAQRAVLNADSLLSHGSVERAESLYYADARNHPHDPQARWNLGTYLISRGADRIGMTLIEEAEQFGFDKVRAGHALAPIYLELGEFKKLIALPPTALSAGERERARYLDTHPTRTIAPDSAIVVAYTPSGPTSLLGTIPIRINGRSVVAVIVNSGLGLVLASGGPASPTVRAFAGQVIAAKNDAPAVADSIGVSRLVVVNVPVTLMALPAGTEARISLAFLARYAPTFDVRAKSITLRQSGSTSFPTRAGTPFSALRTDGQYSLLNAGTWTLFDDPSIAQLVDSRRWTLDTKRGTLIVAP